MNLQPTGVVCFMACIGSGQCRTKSWKLFLDCGLHEGGDLTTASTPLKDSFKAASRAHAGEVIGCAGHRRKKYARVNQTGSISLIYAMRNMGPRLKKLPPKHERRRKATKKLREEFEKLPELERQLCDVGKLKR